VSDEQKKDSNLFRIDDTAKIIKNPDILMRNILSYFSAKLKEFDSFEKLDKDKDIVHFKNVTITKNKLNSIKEKIEKVKRSKNKEKEEQMLMEKFEKRK